MALDRCVMTCPHRAAPLPKNPLPPPTPSSSPTNPTATGLFTMSMVLLFPGRHGVGITQEVAFAGDCLSLRDAHLRRLPLFSRTARSLLCRINNIPLCGFHSPKDTWVSSKVWRVRIKLLHTSVCRLFCGGKFQLLWVYTYQGMLLLWTVR